MSDSMREALEKAYDQHAGGNAGQAESVGQDPEKTQGTTGTGESAEKTQGTTGTGESAEGTPVPEATGASSEKADEPEKKELKFLPAGEEVEKKAEESIQTENVGRPPVSWKGDAKGAWADLPGSVRDEVLRREKETTQVLRESANAREFEQQFYQTIQPFQGFIAAEQSTPLQAVNNLMQTAATLRVGTPQQKATVAADIISQFGIDIQMLDSLLAGKAPQQSQQGGMPAGLDQYLDQRLAPVNNLMQELQQARQSRSQRIDEEVDKEYKDFLDSDEAMYFEDVRSDMADLLDRAARRGEKMTIKQAYEKAVRMSPELSAKVAQQKSQEQAQAHEASIERKKRASVSVQGVPPGPSNANPPTDLRSSLEAAWDQVESGGRV